MMNFIESVVMGNYLKTFNRLSLRKYKLQEKSHFKDSIWVGCFFRDFQEEIIKRKPGKNEQEYYQSQLSEFTKAAQKLRRNTMVDIGYKIFPQEPKTIEIINRSHPLLIQNSNEDIQQLGGKELYRLALGYSLALINSWLSDFVKLPEADKWPYNAVLLLHEYLGKYDPAKKITSSNARYVAKNDYRLDPDQMSKAFGVFPLIPLVDPHHNRRDQYLAYYKRILPILKNLCSQAFIDASKDYNGLNKDK